MPGAPVVTGVSPKEGSPLTKITIRGENLGKGKHDILKVYICGQDCTLTAEWQSSSKIICRTGQGMGRGDIIVITKSGGKGTSTVGFTGIKAKKVGPLDASPVWVDETQYIDQRLDRNQKVTNLSLRSDPLGILSDDSGSKAPSNMNLTEMYPNGSPDPTDENFVPAWFLIERHFTTSFKQLKEGHTYMKRRATRNTNNAPLNHVKDSLPVFFEVQDMLSSVHQKMVKDEVGRDNSKITTELQQYLQDASSNAENLFTTVLKCKDRADSIRNTLGVLQRFKFLFYLPLNIERNIKKGDYGVVINDYIKARSLFADTDVQVFRKVYGEVEKQMEEFHTNLLEELNQLPLPLTRQKALIRFLLELGDGSTDNDPAWNCLDNQHNWIQEQMNKCKDEHLERAADDSRNQSSKTSSVPKEFLAELAAIATTQIPEHWNLWEEYASGVILIETGEKSKDVEKLKSMASKHSKQMKNLLRDTIILFVNLLRAAFLPATISFDEANEEDVEERKSYGVWPDLHVPAKVLADCVRITRNVLNTLSKLEIKEQTLKCLVDLIHDMRVLCLSSFMQEASMEIANLVRSDDWEVDRTGITSLPTEFKFLMERLVVTLSDTLQSHGSEVGIFKRDAVQSRVHELTTDLFLSFTSTLDRIVFGGDVVDNDLLKKSQFAVEKNVLAIQEKIVVAMSNVRYVKEKIIPVILPKFVDLEFPQMQLTQEKSQQAFVDLDERLFDAYVEQRVEPLCGKLEPGMYSGYFSWSTCVRPTDVRPYVNTALTGIITIYAEVYTICPGLVRKVIEESVKSVAEELLRLMQCVQKFSSNGALQARVDIMALQAATRNYATDDSNKAFKDACSALSQLANSAEKNLAEDILNRFRAKMTFHFKCLDAIITDGY